jgi:hypothetical protein
MNLNPPYLSEDSFLKLGASYFNDSESEPSLIEISASDKTVNFFASNALT